MAYFPAAAEVPAVVRKVSGPYTGHAVLRIDGYSRLDDSVIAVRLALGDQVIALNENSARPVQHTLNSILRQREQGL